MASRKAHRSTAPRQCGWSRERRGFPRGGRRPALPDYLPPHTRERAVWLVEWRGYQPGVRREVDDVLDEPGITSGFLDAEAVYARRHLEEMLGDRPDDGMASA